MKLNISVLNKAMSSMNDIHNPKNELTTAFDRDYFVKRLWTKIW